jgi:sorbose reductase
MLPEFSLHGKVAVVMGGARGLGLEMMWALARVGAEIESHGSERDPVYDSQTNR